MGNFSERHGYQPADAEISVRNDAPEELCAVLVDLAYAAGMKPREVREVVCRTLLCRSDPRNWSDFPNIDGEIRGHIDQCEWYEVYDIAKSIHAKLKQHIPMFVDGSAVAPDSKFQHELNRYFKRRGIGWQMQVGRIEVRGTEAFQESVSSVHQELASSGRSRLQTRFMRPLPTYHGGPPLMSRVRFSMRSPHWSAWLAT